MRDDEGVGSGREIAVGGRKDSGRERGGRRGRVGVKIGKRERKSRLGVD